MNRVTSRLLVFLLGLLLVQAVSAKVQSVDPADLVSSDRLGKTAVIITKVIERYHYKKAPLDDALSEQILDRYLEALDPNRSFFLAKDIARIQVYRDSLDDELRSGNVDAAFEIFRIYRRRVEERVAKALGLLDRANASYVTALHFDPTNRQAARGLSQVRKELKPSTAH